MRFARKGCIAPGMDADLVVLSDKLEVQHVMAGGCWHIKNGEQQILGSFEAEYLN